MADDTATSRFYSDNATAYAARSKGGSRARLDAFLARLPAGAEILELGCGAGADSAEMIARGFRARPTDGTPEMAEEAGRRLGIAVPVLRFDDIDMVGAFDGVWANACLLHAPRGSLGGILAKIHMALRPGGVFYATFKAGEGEGYDSLGRYYNYPTAEWLAAAYHAMAWVSVEIDENDGGGYDGQPTRWLHVTSIKA